MKRLFIAIKIKPGPGFLNTYYSLKKDLVYEKIKWVNEDNFHFTLKFLGETDESLITDISNTLENISLNTQPIKLKIENLGIFGSRYNPRVIWAGIENNPQITEFANEILNKLDEVGFMRDRQNFVPHITIGRIKNIQNKKYLKSIIDEHNHSLYQEDIVNSFCLFESVLTPAGPVYKKLKEFGLKLQL
jgi:2'-5' RNA ligase